MPFSKEHRWTTFLLCAAFAFMSLAVGAAYLFAKQGMRTEALGIAAFVAFALNGVFAVIRGEINTQKVLGGQQQVTEEVKQTVAAAAGDAKEAAEKTRTDVRHDVRNELQATVLASALKRDRPHECWQTLRATVLAACPEITGAGADALCDKILDLLDKRAAALNRDDGGGPNPPNANE
jgi:hypothetical protein